MKTKAARLQTIHLWALLAAGMALMACHALAWAACNPAQQPTAYRVSGDEVLDLQTGLTWKRCSIGQRFEGGRCVGSAVAVDWDAADEAAGAAGGQWRLPTREELARLAQVTCQSTSGPAPTFPNTPGAWYWSSTQEPLLGAGGTWFVSFAAEGGAGASLRNANAVVRLVRGEPARQEAANQYR